jgi:hypothetical protein
MRTRFSSSKQMRAVFASQIIDQQVFFDHGFNYNVTSGEVDVDESQLDYSLLNNIPSIEGVPLVGNRTFPQLTLTSLTNQEIEALLS